MLSDALIYCLNLPLPLFFSYIDELDRLVVPVLNMVGVEVTRTE
jgi:hypothetical protein